MRCSIPLLRCFCPGGRTPCPHDAPLWGTGSSELRALEKQQMQGAEGLSLNALHRPADQPPTKSSVLSPTRGSFTTPGRWPLDRSQERRQEGAPPCSCHTLGPLRLPCEAPSPSPVGGFASRRQATSGSLQSGPSAKAPAVLDSAGSGGTPGWGGPCFSSPAPWGPAAVLVSSRMARGC